MSSTVDAKKLQADESTNKKIDNNKYAHRHIQNIIFMKRKDLSVYSCMKIIFKNRLQYSTC